MSSIGFATSTKALLKGAKTVMVVAPAAVFRKNRFPALLGKKNDALVVLLAKGLRPGDLGNSATTLTTREPAELAVGVLPDHVSRGNSPTRAESVRRVVSGAKGGKGKLAIILVVDDPDHVLAQAIAVGRCFPQFSGKSQPGKERRVQILAVDRKGKPVKVPAHVGTFVGAVRDSAELVDTPPSELDPESFSARAQAFLEGIEGITVEEIVGDDLLDRGLGGIHAVGRCALPAPRLLMFHYDPGDPGDPGASKKAKDAKKANDAEDSEGESKQQHIALVGKGVTYDTGGLNLKIGGNMSGMKCDMGGAAAVLGAFRCIVAAGTRHKVSLLLCMAENAIGPAAYKPDDIITMHSGKTVEINNTDAEGRLLLADGVSWAARELEADIIFDAATLTGAQLIATGLLHGALYAADGELEQAMIDAGRRCGDLAHPLPFAPEFFRQEFSSVVADMCNSVRNRMNAQSACAGQFVYNHISDTDARWVHLDLAGPAFPKDRGTGYGVALLATTVLGL